MVVNGKTRRISHPCSGGRGHSSDCSHPCWRRGSLVGNVCGFRRFHLEATCPAEILHHYAYEEQSRMKTIIIATIMRAMPMERISTSMVTARAVAPIFTTMQGGKPPIKLLWRFPKIRRTILGVPARPYSKDHSVFGSILGPLIFKNSHILLRMNLQVVKCSLFGASTICDLKQLISKAGGPDPRLQAGNAMSKLSIYAHIYIYTQYRIIHIIYICICYIYMYIIIPSS